MLTSNFQKEKMPIAKKTKFSNISDSYSLRCDAKQSEKRFIEFDQLMKSIDHFFLGEFLPNPMIKGIQPDYLESDAVGIPVINTLSIQNLMINIETCRFISDEDFENLDNDRKLKIDDVLLTLDGGTSIGKPVLFNLEGDYTVDSHVAIIRPSLNPKILIYLLASPIGQLQFNQAESGASGQTAVTEEDLRRFRFPRIELETLQKLVTDLDDVRTMINIKFEKLKKEEQSAWDGFFSSLVDEATNRKSKS